jgi:hypothetical protein
MIGKNVIKLDKCVEDIPGFNRGRFYNPSDVLYITSTDEIVDEPFSKLYILQSGTNYIDILMLWDGKDLVSTRTLLSQA